MYSKLTSPIGQTDICASRYNTRKKTWQFSGLPAPTSNHEETSEKPKLKKLHKVIVKVKEEKLDRKTTPDERTDTQEIDQLNVLGDPGSQTRRKMNYKGHSWDHWMTFD